MKVSEIMSHKVAFVNTNNSIQEAAQRMKELNLGDLPVIAENEAIGVITEHDIAIRVVARGFDPKTYQVVDAMTKGIFSCKEDDPIVYAAQEMAKIKIGRLAVRDHHGKLSGMVSIDDLVDHLDPDSAHQILKKLAPH